MTKKTALGFIGLGMMGKYMAKNLLKNHYQVIGYNRSKKVLRELKKSGLVVATTPAQVGEQSEIIILMLPSAKETKEVIFGQNGLSQGLSRGQIVIDMSTSNPDDTIKIKRRLKTKGVQMLAAPVSRGQRAAVNATLSIMVGGDKKTFTKCLPVFKALGNFIVHLGPFGSGLYVKALNNFLFALNLMASTQGLMIIKKNKINLRKSIEVISESSGHNRAMAISINRNLGLKRPSIGFYLRHMAKDVNIFSQVARNQKVKNSLAKPVLAFYQAMAKKYGQADTMYVFEHLLVKNQKLPKK